MVGDFAADVAVLLVFLDDLDVERDGLFGMGQGAHRFLHAGEDLCAAMLPIGGRANRGARCCPRLSNRKDPGGRHNAVPRPMTWHCY